MPSLSQVANLASGDPLPESYVDAVTDDLNYLVVAGADIASATSITVTNRFHKVTGTTTIDTITHAAPVAGQRLQLWCASALTIRNNGGGTGNVQTSSGQDRRVAANEIIGFIYDGATWREAYGQTKPLTALGTFTGKNNGSGFTSVAMGTIVWDDGYSWGTVNTYCAVPAAGRYRILFSGFVTGQTGTGSGSGQIVRADSSSAAIETLGSQNGINSNTNFQVIGAGLFNAGDRILIQTTNGANGSAGSVAGRVLIEQIL